MHIELPLFAGLPGVTLSIELRRNGLAFIAESEILIKKVPKVTATLLLRWVEVAVIGGLVVLAALVVNFRQQISASWLISEWALHNTYEAAGIISFLAFGCGCLLAFWKRKQLFVYGMAEIVFGTFSAFQIALFLWPKGEPSQFVALASALYVISRGAGNVSEAFAKEVEIQRLKLEVVRGAPPEPWPPSILRQGDPTTGSLQIPSR